MRYVDGRILKGYSQDFHTSRQHFHVSEAIGQIAGPPLLVTLSRLKAVFFVKDFQGDARRVERKSFAEPVAGRRIEITFVDGEVLLGATLGYRPDGPGFFVTPADTHGNNLRVFVLRASIRQIRYL